MTIGDRIKIARTNAGLTQKELASRLGVTYQAVQAYEKNKVDDVPMNKIRIMAKVLGVEPDWLLGWEIKKPIQEDELSDMKKELIKIVESLSEEEVAAVLRILKR